MKIKNKDLKVITQALVSLGNHQGDIRNRWEITKLAKAFSNATETLDLAINQLIRDKGEIDEMTGQKSLDTTDKDFLTLMELDIEVDVECLTLDRLSQFMPSTQEMISLMSIIKEE